MAPWDQISMCQNARRPEGECGYALCAPCYQKKLSEDSCMAGGRRGSHRRPTKRDLYKVPRGDNEEELMR